MKAPPVASPFETAAAQPPQGEERDRRIAFLGTTSGDSRSHSRDTIFARALQIHRPSPKRGRRESRALTAPAAPRAMVVKNAHGFDRYSRDIPAFPAQWLYDLLRALPGERRFLSPLPRQHGPAWIDATVAAPGPHDFAVRRTSALRRRRACVHRIPPHVS